MHDGTYKFYLKDELVYEQKNAITVAGRAIITKSLMGLVPSFGNAIGVGIGNTANTINSFNLVEDNSLEFEVARTQVSASDLDVTQNNNLLVYSTVLNVPEAFTIHEVGLFPTITNTSFTGVRNSTIFTFDSVDVFTRFGSASAARMTIDANARLGTDLFYVPDMDGVNSYLKYSFTPGELLYLDYYSSQDIFRLAGYNPANQSSSVYFRFYSDSTNYYELIFNTSSSGYFMSTVTKDSAILSGTPNWNNVAFTDFWQSGGTEGIYLDALRVGTGSYFLDTTTGMVSRAVLQSPLRKPSSVPLTIEYSLGLGFNLD